MVPEKAKIVGLVILSKAKNLTKLMIYRSFTEFTLSPRSSPFVSLRVTKTKGSG